MENSYPLDNSGIIHFATLTDKYSNLFRISVHLKEDINTDILQEAANKAVLRYPSIAAFIKHDNNRYYVVPVKNIVINNDDKILNVMSLKQIENCAIRILYHQNMIAVEFFHALCDGYSGLLFVKYLVSNYLSLLYHFEIKEEVIDYEKEIEDSFKKYAGKTCASRNISKSYQIPWDKKGNDILIGSIVLDIASVKDKANQYQTTITTLLVAVMFKSIMAIQDNKESIQIMVPVNLRNKFDSISVRNFSLFALVSIGYKYHNASIYELLYVIKQQLAKQYNTSYLQEMISANVRLEDNLFIKKLPLSFKMKMVKLGFKIGGSKNSCLTLSNLGKCSFNEFDKYIDRVDLMLSPRLFAANDDRRSAYNCGIISFENKMFINFSRCNDKAKLEDAFLKYLKDLDISVIEINNL